MLMRGKIVRNDFLAYHCKVMRDTLIEQFATIFFSILFKNYANKWRTKNEEMALLCMLIFYSDNFCTHIYCCVRDGTKHTHNIFSIRT